MKQILGILRETILKKDIHGFLRSNMCRLVYAHVFPTLMVNCTKKGQVIVSMRFGSSQNDYRLSFRSSSSNNFFFWKHVPDIMYSRSLTQMDLLYSAFRVWYHWI